MAETFTEDVRIWPLLVELLDCYKSELTTRGLAADCMVTLSPGVAVDLGGTGDYGWVRLATIFPSTAFPLQEQTAVSCGTPYAATVDLGMARCIEVPETTIIDELDNAEYVRKQMADWAAMRAAVDCCMKKQGFLVMSGNYTPFGPEGGMYGGVLSVSVGASPS